MQIVLIGVSGCTQILDVYSIRPVHEDVLHRA
jgi:hypothetical protein